MSNVKVKVKTSDSLKFNTLKAKVAWYWWLFLKINHFGTFYY